MEWETIGKYGWGKWMGMKEKRKKRPNHSRVDDHDTVDTLDHLPPLPLLVDYWSTSGMEVTERDELGIYQVLRLHDRLRRIELVLPPSILHKIPVLMNGHFPILEHLYLSFRVHSGHCLPLMLPKAFLAPNLRYLTLPGISPPRRLRMLTSTVFLVRLALSNIQISSYFHPRLLVARLRSLPQLKILMIRFPLPYPVQALRGSCWVNKEPP